MLIKLLTLITILPQLLTQQPSVNIKINNTDILTDPDTFNIFNNGVLSSEYDDTIFNQFLNC